jgi:hypothetical protein
LRGAAGWVVVDDREPQDIAITTITGTNRMRARYTDGAISSDDPVSTRTNLTARFRSRALRTTQLVGQPIAFG